MTAAFPFRAVSFDVDGTLYDLLRAKLRMALNSPFDLKYLATVSRIREDLRATGAVTDASLRPLVLDQVAKRLGLSLADAGASMTARLDEGWARALRAAAPIPGVRSVIAELVSQRVKIAIVSDYPAEAKLRALGLCDFPWDAIVNCENEGAYKPHPRGFERLIARLGVAPRDCLHVGDREECDGVGARSVGMASRIVRGKAAWLAFMRDVRGASAR